MVAVVHLELAGSRNDSEDLNETSIVGLQPVSRSDFFTILGRLAEPDGICEPITVIEDAAQALAVAAKLASALRLVVHRPCLAYGGRTMIRDLRTGERILLADIIKATGLAAALEEIARNVRERSPMPRSPIFAPPV